MTPYATCNQISHCHVRASTWGCGVGEMRFGTCTAVGVAGESREIIYFGCSRGPPSFRAFVLLDFALSSKHTRKKE